MLLVGGSLVAYFTWTRHWLFRYTLVPGLFAFFTGGLGLVARWLERSDSKLSGTAAMLRGAAIALLPVNCMSVSLLADDPNVTAKWVAVPLMAGLYLVVMTFGLRSWTSAVYAPLGGMLTPALLFLNALVLLRPLARLLAESWGLRPAEVFAFGFYAGFFVAADRLRRFSAHAHDTATARESRIVWFAAFTLALTYLQVFGWVHAWEQQWPVLAVYGPLIVMGGGVAFFVERQLRVTKSDEASTAEESFIGFALILAGVVASSRDPYLRVVSGALAGVLWLYQAAFRNSVPHTYLGLLLLTLAAASINLLPGLSLAWSPVVGYSIALLMGAIAVDARRRGVSRVELAARELQRALLVITGIVAVLAHSHFKTPQRYTGLALLFVAFLLFYRSVQSERRRDGFIGATMAAMAMPYLGFADMQGRDFAGNTLTFGLALLSLAWLALIRATSSEALRRVRTAALSLYGVFALAAMLARVLLERQNPPPPSLIASLPEYLGPLMMLGVLAYTTYLARSMLPFIVGLFIVFALLPGLKADFRILFPWLSWGSGLGSAAAAALALGIAQGLRRRTWSDEGREPDQLFDGSLLPLNRSGHSLFTTPLVLLAAGLALRVEFYSAIVQLPLGPSLKTVVAVLLCSAIWTLVAIWRRDESGGSLLRLGPLSLLWGFWLLSHRNGDVWAWQWPVLWTGVVLQVSEIVVTTVVLPSRAWIRAFLLEPIERWLETGSLVAGAALIAAHLFGAAPADLRWLGLFVLAQLIRPCLRPRELGAGSLFAVLTLVMVASEFSPGAGPLFARLSYEHSLPWLMRFAATTLAALGLLEARQEASTKFLRLIAPLRLGSAVVVGWVTVLALINATAPERIDLLSLLMAFAGWLLVARWTIPGPSLLMASIIGFLAALHPALLRTEDLAARQDLLVAPFGLALLSLIQAVVLVASRNTASLRPGLLSSPWPGSFANSRVTAWLHLPSLILSLLAVTRHLLVDDLRRDPSELIDPYLASAALFLLAAIRGTSVLASLASLTLSLANYHVVQWGAGDLLRARGLSDIHVAAIGVGAAVVMVLVLRAPLGLLLQGRRVTRILLAGPLLVLALLNANFTADPNLGDLTGERLIVSASLAFLAGWFFRKLTLATLPDLPEVERDRSVGVAHAVYHLGVAMALWCLILLVPAFRSPVAALFGLSLPVAYFQIAAERFKNSDATRAVRYARSAAAIASAAVLLYAARPIFQIVFFPESQIRSDYYHYNAPLMVALGLVLIRLNAFETHLGVGTLGGIAVFTGAYFGISGFPFLSPFEHPFEGAWLAVFAGHAFTWLVSRSQRWRKFLKGFASIDDGMAESLARGFHLYLVAAPLLAAFAALLRVGPDTYGTGAILGGASSVWLMRGTPNRLATIPVGLLLVMGSIEAVMRPALLSEAGIIAIAFLCLRLDPGPFALALSLATYGVALNRELLAAVSDADRFSIALSPNPLVLLGLMLALAVEGERRLLSGLSARLLYWLGGPAALFSIISVLRPRFEGADPTLAQIGVDYAASAAHALLGLWAGTEVLLISATGLLTLAHLAAIDWFVGPAMAAHGLGIDHRLAAALGLTLLTLWPIRATRRSVDSLRAVIAVVLAAVLLGHYAIEPGLSRFTGWRGLLVSVLWFIGAAALRDASGRGGTLGLALRVLDQASVACGLIALALATPLMRTPALSLATLALPALYFAFRTETAADERGRRENREAAVVAGLLVLPFYLSRFFWSALLDPSVDLPLRHYHTQSMVLIVVGLILARSHSFGAPFGVALTGAIAMMGGSYFAVTSFEGLSPFEAPMEGAFAGIALLHLWTFATTQHRSAAGLLGWFAGLDKEAWARVRTLAGLLALWAVQFLVLYAIADPRRPDVAVAALLLGGATLFFHHGYHRGMTIYFDLGGLQLLAALHADRLVPSALDLRRVVWVLLLLRAFCVWALYRPSPDPVTAEWISRWRVVLAIVILGHVFFHRPWTGQGLFAFALLTLSVAFMPRATLSPASYSERLAAFALIFTPVWLVHFYSAPWGDIGASALFITEPLLRTMLALLLTAAAARTVGTWAGVNTPKRSLSIHQVRSLLIAEGAVLHDGIVAVLSIAYAAVIVTHYGVPYTTPEIVIFTALLVGLGYAWYRDGRRRRSWVPCFVGEIHVAAALALLRRQLMLTTSFWSYEYDLWLSLAASATFTGLKQRLVHETDAPELHRPVTLTLLLIPAVALYWTLANGLGADMVLLVVGLNSVLFAFLGHDRRNSPYNLLAVAGFVSFVALVFWSKLELRVLHAYVVPVALGVLVIAQLFERELKPGVLSTIRLASLSAMLGSAMYHALLDARYPVVFNLTVLVLCLASMAFGALVRVRLYVTLGLSVLMLDLASLAAKALAGMESQARMTWIGLGVFALGALIVGIGVYHKGRGAEFDEALERLKRRLSPRD